jgi:ethanolamine ammonia-lyase large subunit
MIHRRRFLALNLAAAAVTSTGLNCIPGVGAAISIAETLESWMQKTHGGWNYDAYRQLLGAANDFKEGDAIVGVAARDEEQRRFARQLLEQTPLRVIDEHPPHRDQLWDFINAAIDRSKQLELSSLTFGELRQKLLTLPESDIHVLRTGLSSDVIACVVRIMSNEQLIQLGSRLFNPLPGSRIGSKGYMGARVQPNSPTDHPDDIRWQVFDAFAYGVGDVLLGTNPVSSEPASVAAVELALRDILETFGIADVMPHCVLSHIDVQSQVEQSDPGSTALWFQSIAGNDSANKTFDISIEKMRQHAESRTGRFALYFETGQGADFTNGHGHGVDMVTFESRKYGFARALTADVAASLKTAGRTWEPWVHLNDVAGFIGPEVFRSREQLVRCCLEDIAMGKLHGLTIGLDICSTLHMDVSLDDLGWCIDQIMPANPAYLMALPTRIDPMLGYLTTGYQDHVHIRERFGYRVSDPMWSFFQTLEVIDVEGRPTPHFGDPAWVYLQYRQRKGDTRSDQEILQEAATQIREVRARGVFLADGFGKQPAELNPELAQQIHTIYDDAKLCIWEELPAELGQQFPAAIALHTRSENRTDYILHPAGGEQLSGESESRLQRLKESSGTNFDVQLVVSDGLNALAVIDGNTLQVLLEELRAGLTKAGRRVSPSPLIVHGGRVRAGYRIGEQLFGGRSEACSILHIIGERPGTGHRTLSIYMTTANGSQWSVPNEVDHNITKVISGIAQTALVPKQAAIDALRVLQQMR